MIASNAAMLIAGALGVGLACAIGRRAIAVLLGAIVVALWLTPVLAMVLPLESWAAEIDWLPTTWTQRLYIYARAGSEIFAHPFGGGVEYARSLSRPIETVTIEGLDLPTMPLHPHNLFLHVWMDLGVIGALSMTGLVASVWLGFKRIVLTRTEAAMVAGVVAALLVTATTEWSLWQVWRFASVWIAMIGCRLAIGGLPIR
jgi:O-antigen ligase